MVNHGFYLSQRLWFAGLKKKETMLTIIVLFTPVLYLQKQGRNRLRD